MDDDNTAAADDERLMELETLEAIFPEIQKLSSSSDKLVSFSIEIPVNPATPVTVAFPATANNGAPPTTTTTTTTTSTTAAAAAPAADGQGQGQELEPRVDSQQLAHLPAVVLRVDLPAGYPADDKPAFTLTTDPPWLSPSAARAAEREGVRLWNDLGRTQVVYAFIDHVQQAADAVFGMADADGLLRVDPAHKIAILDHDIKARKAAFDRETFDCGVCLEPRKGAACHRMLDCDHVFCRSCLQDFYNNAIAEGDLAVVRCLFPDCAKRRAEAAGGSNNSRRRKARTYINPSELLQMGLDMDTVTRYVTLKYKNELESDKNTIYCPRSWCNGAARSKKHKKPQGLELGHAFEDDDDDEESEPNGSAGDNNAQQQKAPTAKRFDRNDLLAICEDCGFAFCSRCLQSWHGEFIICAPPRDSDEITAEEQASLDYLRLHTSPCPTCDAPVQKTHGCNHMVCFRCATHFCYLCSAWLEPSNPYQHYNTQPTGKVTSCYQRLWELEAGDGDNVGLGFAGGGRPVDPQNLFDDFSDDDLEPEWSDDEDDDVHVAAPAVVARIPPPAPQAPPPPRGRGGQRGGRGARGGGGQPARGGRGGRGGGRGGARPPNGGHAPAAPRGNPLQDIDALDPDQEAWVRNFVRLALMDEEDSGDDEDVPPRRVR